MRTASETPAPPRSPAITSKGAPSRLRAVLAIVAGLIIAFGVFVRFDHVERRVFWDDEVIATIHIVGVTEAELVARAGAWRTMGELRAALHPTAPLRSPEATIAALRSEDPQHPPAFYLLARLWAGLFGDSRTALRLLSAVIGLVALPCVFWLCMELFASPVAAWSGVALLAISPVAVVYSQEVREYGLWIVAILVTSALFVRAVRRGTTALWIAYAVALAASLYIFPASAFVGLAHAATAFFAPATSRTRLVALAAIVVGGLLFAPWLAVMATHADQINRGMATINLVKTSPLAVVRTFIGVVRLDILDLNGTRKLLAALASVPIIAITVYALYALRSTAGPVARVLIWALVVCTTLPILAPDLVMGGARTANVRYFMPLFVACDLAFVALFAACIAGSDERPRRRMAWLAAFALIVVVRSGSCALAANAQTWWSDYNNGSIAIAAALNAAPHPLVVSDDYLVWAASLSEYADPTIPLALDPHCYLCTTVSTNHPNLAGLTAAPIANVFALAPSPALHTQVTDVLAHESHAPAYHCIDVRGNCADGLHLFSLVPRT